MESSVNPIIAESSGWRAAFYLGVEVTSISTDDIVQASRRTKPSHGERQRRVVVEVFRGAGGIFPRGALGARYTTGGESLNFSVATISEMWTTPGQHFDSVLSTPMVVGLPREFADAVVDGLLAASDRLKILAGDFEVDFAAYDEVNSSPCAFEHAARLLLWAVAYLESGEAVDSRALRAELDSWSHISEERTPHFQSISHVSVGPIRPNGVANLIARGAFVRLEGS